MCCDECPNYEACTENDQLKDECCARCPSYNDCIGTDSEAGSSSVDSGENSGYDEEV